MSAVHPISQAWISTGGTGAQNYDEFADDAEISRILQDAPYSALGVEMPHRAPDSLGATFAEALPAAAERLAAAQRAGAYRSARDVLGVYRISGRPGGRASYGVFAMVDTAEISGRADEPGLVIRNEDVFLDKVRERVALIEAVDHLLSPVLLLQTEHDAALQDALVQVTETVAPDVRDVDQAGRVHEVWAVFDPAVVGRICDLAGGGELVVADGNHRSLAAQTAGLTRFLSVVTTPGSVDLDPYHRLLSTLPEEVPDLVEALRSRGAQVSPLEGPTEVPGEPGVVHLHTPTGGYAVRLPVPAGAAGVDRLDHAVVEAVVVRDVLGWDPGDKRIRYIGGDYPAAWLREQVDAGLAAVAVLIAPVRVDDFVAVNLARTKMPRKSTWFTPKARAGLVVARREG
jgi:uncharacterized protein (DUF1015 family)